NKFLDAKSLKNALEEHKLYKVEINVDGIVRLLQKFADVDYIRLARVLWRNRYDKAWEASGAQNNWGMFSTAGEVVEAVIYSHAHDEAPSQTPPASLELLPPLQQSGDKKQAKVYDTAHKAAYSAASMFAFRSVKPLFPIGKEPHGKYCAWKTKDPNAKWEAAEIT
ncbi:hypothetical protein HaLaN_28220, partial [Haematococcus lacustris]